MFDNLTEKFSQTLRNLSGRGQLTEDNIQEALANVRRALLEADVALPVVKSFIEDVKVAALGEKVLSSLNPDQVFIKIVHHELVKIMGEHNDQLNLAVKPPAIILMAGLQGAGKTTSVAKLARWLKAQKKKVMVVSADIYRPAAITQLETLSHSVGALFFPSQAEQTPLAIVQGAVDAAQRQFADVLIVDTAGRLHVDDDMMGEIKQLHSALNPVETLFVVDAMTGQDAANTALAFSQVLPLTGIILTKADGDARGGAALSVRYITGKPIKFLGMGEKTDALQPFYPDRIASRILGMGDVLSLVEQVERDIDKKKANQLVQRLKKGKAFDFNDMLDQFGQMKKMGGIASLLDKLPGMSNMAQAVKASSAHEQHMKQMEAIIQSMTRRERAFPDLVSGSRKQRIALGSGTQLHDVNRLLKQQKQMEKMMKKFSKKGGARQAMQAMQGMMGGGGGFTGLR